jgi:hypothetical protein
MGNVPHEGSGNHDLSDLAALHLGKTPVFAERTKKSFELAAESVKQIVTLSTAIVTLVATVFRDVLKSPTGVADLIVLALIAMIVSIAFGAWSLMALAGTLGSKKVLVQDVTIFRFSIRIPATLQVIFFVLGLALLVLFATMGASIAVRPE